MTRASRNGGHFLREFGYDAFERALVLPEGVDQAGVTAKYTNGMLEISIPAPVAASPRKVKIKIEDQPKAIQPA